MSLWNTLTREFVDVIDWTQDDGQTMVWRFERFGNEIKYGAKLTVRDGQAAVFVHEGRVADVFGPGLYFLETNNLPILTALLHWDHGFRSPFKSEIYFISLKRFIDLKWGTKNPIMLRDPEFGPVRLRAFGTYSVRIADPAKFLREIVGTDDEFSTDGIEGQIRNIIVSRFSSAIASVNIPVLDLAANYDALGEFLRERITSDLAEYGLELPRLLVENISLPSKVEAALDRRTQMGVIGDLRQYTMFQAAEALRSQGAAQAGIGAGMGMILAQQMGAHLGGHTAPPPLPHSGANWYIALNGQQAGPLTAEALRAMAEHGQINAETLVWREGLSDWTPLGQIEQLLASPSAPPPLPQA